MTLPELGRALSLRLSRWATWAAFLFVLGLYGSVLTYDGHHGTSLAFSLVQLLSASLFYFAFVWLSPLPWQWDGCPGQRRAGWRQTLQAFLLSEVLMICIVLLESTLARALGVGPYSFRIYMVNLCFQGPALFLVGLLLAQQDHLSQEWLASRRQAQEATGHQLKGQLHPHALFNALNGLAELIGDDPAGAEVFVEAMSSFLRRILEASRRNDWPIEEERLLAEDYLLMEGMRLGVRLQVAWEWDLALDRQLVSPLLLQPMLENAVKHGINPCESGGQLRVVARKDGAHLLLEVGNTGSPLVGRREPRHGIGLQNLQKRLELAYGEQAQFILQSGTGGWTWARVRITLFPAPT